MKRYCFFLFVILAFLLMPQSIRAHDLSLSGLMDVRFNTKRADGEAVPAGSTYRNGLSYNLELYPQLRLEDNWTITAILAYAKMPPAKQRTLLISTAWPSTVRSKRWT